MMTKFALIILSTILLILLTTSTTNAQQDDVFSPSPTYSGSGGIDVGEDFVLRTLSPTIDVNQMTGRGIPTKAPTHKPSYSPTEEDFGGFILPDVPDVIIPVSPNPPPNPSPQQQLQDKEETDSPSIIDEDPDNNNDDAGPTQDNYSEPTTPDNGALQQQIGNNNSALFTFIVFGSYCYLILAGIY